MKIGIDIDDTITNSSDIFVEYAKLYNKNKHIDFIINQNEIDTELSFGWSKENLHEFSKKYLKVILETAMDKEESIKVINKLKSNGNKIYFITARNKKETKDMHDLTKKWLDTKGYHYNKLITDSKNKLNDCIKYKIDVFIDDNYNNCKSIKDNLKIPVMLFTTRYNEKINDKSLIRVSNWAEIYEKLKRMC